MTVRLRIVLTLGLASGVALGSAWAQDPAAAAQLFKQKCTTCHSASKAVDGTRKFAEPDRATQLEKFLSTHFCPDANERKAIVQHLLGEAASK